MRWPGSGAVALGPKVLAGPIAGGADAYIRLPNRIARIDAGHIDGIGRVLIQNAECIGCIRVLCPGIWEAPLRTRRLSPAMKSPRTTKLYDRTSDEITLDEIERIRI